jgi:NHL repeat
MLSTIGVQSKICVSRDPGVVKAVDSSVWVFHRGARIWDASSYDNGGSGERITFADPIQGNTILNLDADTGKLLGGFGSDFFYMPHGIAMDRESNIWVTDVGLHQVSVPISHVLPTGPVLFWLIRC